MLEEPRARGIHRFNIGPPSTLISLIKSFKGSALPLWTAFATADRKILRIWMPALWGATISSASALFTGIFLTTSAKSRALRGAIFAYFILAVAIFSMLFFYCAVGILLFSFLFLLFLHLTAMADELLGRRELSKPMTNHIFIYPHFNKILAVVNGKKVADHIGRDFRASAPCLYGHFAFEFNLKNFLY